MRNLSDTIARLVAQRSLGTHVQGPAPDRLSDLTGFGSNPGALRARTYLPENLGRKAPLVVVLHGCTQTASAYDFGSGWSHLADQDGFALLFPEQQRANNPNLCFNWFVPADIRRDSGEALSIRQMIAAMLDAHGLDPDRVFVTGLSAGGAMAATMLAAYPEVFAGGAVIAGLPHGVAATIPQAFDRMRGHGGPSAGQLQDLLRSASSHKGPWPTISVWQGAADQTVAPSNADAIVSQWRGVHRLPAMPARTETVDGQTRRVWTDADGRDRIDVYSIAGMGHGAPLGAADGLGTPAPFMLEAGISSTGHIARNWGISSGKALPSIILVPPKQASGPMNAQSSLDMSQDTSTAPRIAKSSAAIPQPPGEKPANGIQRTIENALRAAGLMR